MSPTSGQDDLTSTRRSKSYYVLPEEEPALYARLHDDRGGEGYYGSMFHQDASHVLPFGRGLDDGFSVRISGADVPEVRRLIAEALPTQYPQVNLVEAIDQFFENVAARMIGYPPATFEIDYLFEGETEGQRPVAFRIEPLDPGCIDRYRGNPIQYVPRDMGTATRRSGLSFVKLDPALLVTFELPKQRAREVSGVVRVLSRASELQSAEFKMTQESMVRPTDYDPSAHNRVTGELLLEATRSVGWTMRDLYKDDVLDPYAVWRRLQFKRFRIELRDCILSTLNDTLVTVGERLGFEAQLSIEGVATASSVDEAEADLTAGARSIQELLTFAR